MIFPIPQDEQSRLKALNNLEILDTPDEREIDELTRLAAMICSTPIAFVSLIDGERVWFKSKFGHTMCELPRETAFCAHAILEKDIFIVSDAAEDGRFADNSLVTGEPRIRFYAGAPLVTEEGHAIGTLCVIDRKPRRLNRRQRKALETLACQVVAQIALRRQAASLREMNESLRRSEESHRVVAQSASDVIITIDERAKILFVNPAAEKILGYKPEEMIGGDLSIIIPERFRAAHTAGMRRYLQTNQRNIPWSGVELPALRSDGQEIQVEITFGESREGDTRTFTAVIRDITERKLAAEALRKSEEYRNLFRHANDAILIFDPETETVLDANEKACEIYGFPREEFLGLSLKKISQNVSQGEKQLQKLLSDGTYEEFESVQFSADGTPINFLINSSIIEFQGKPAVLSINRDITSRKQIELEQRAAEAKMRESEERFRSFMNNSPAVAFMKDENGRHVYINETMERVFNLNKDRIIGKTDLEWLPEEAAVKMRENDKRVFAENRTLEVEEIVPTPDGSQRRWMVYKFPFTDARENRFIGGVAVDVTERKAAEENLLKEKNFSETAMASLPGVFYVFDENGKYLRWNENLERVTGYTAQEIARLHPLDLFAGADKKLVEERIVQALTEGEGEVEADFLAKDGTKTPYFFTGRRVVLDGKTCIVGMGIDITERRRAEQQLLHKALHDQLTGLPNRALFLEHLRHAIERGGGGKRRRKSYAVLFLDFDHFKIINDSLGHMEGDKLLRLIAQRLSGVLRAGDIVARLGGDEFTILLDDLSTQDEAVQIAERIHLDLKTPFDLGGRDVSITASIGIAFGNADYQKPEEVLRDADTAMYRAKATGKARHQTFDQSMHEQVSRRLQMQIELRRAIDNEEFAVHYQPIVNLQCGSIVGFEALVRWNHPERGLVSPAEFIPLAEETGLIILLGQWVLRESCRQMRDWQKRIPSAAGLKISVNLSSRQFTQPDLVEQVAAVLRETGLSPRCLKLEITESHVMENSESAEAMMNRLRALNIELSIDDFGTGYSSLSYLHRLPADYLKVDRSFINQMAESEENYEIVRTIIKLAQNLNLRVVAEGIETDEQMAHLQELGCDCGQGFLFSKPLPAVAAENLLECDTDFPLISFFSPLKLELIA